MDRRQFELLLTHPIARRRFLGAALATSAVAVSRPGAPTRAAGTHGGTTRPNRRAFSADPFSLGVASGDPLPDGVVLWTRLAPDPIIGGGMEPAGVEVRWEVASDERFKHIVRTGSETAIADLAHSVHVDVAGLEPSTGYFYRFAAGDAVSPAGRTKTAPALDAPLDRLRFAASSCAHYEHGYFAAYRHLAAEEIDFAVCLGDYIYEYGANGEFSAGKEGPVRTFQGGETITLEDYRNRHALYKTDPDLRAAHAACPWIVTWDDHEVDNDYAGEHSEHDDPVDQFLARRAAAYQAYYEHMPLRADSMPLGPDMRLFRRLTFGDLAEFNVLDTRQYRTDQQCGGIAPACDGDYDPTATLTGPEQEAWLFDGLANSRAKWNVIAQQVMMARLDGDFSANGLLINHDQWDGYPLARQRVLNQFQATGVANPIVLTGDIHASWVSDLTLNFDDENAPAVAAEFVIPSVTSVNPLAGQLAFALPNNPHLKYYDSRHGYTRFDITPGTWTADYRAVQNVHDPAAGIQTIASFVVESGQTVQRSN